MTTKNLDLEHPMKKNVYLTDGGLETTLIFDNNLSLPCFAAFPLLDTPEGRKTLYDYYSEYAAYTRSINASFVFETPTWRLNSDWLKELKYSDKDMNRFTTLAVKLCRRIQDDFDLNQDSLVSGNIGPRRDGYKADLSMTIEESYNYHLPQILQFSRNGVDLVTAITLTNVNEAVGIVLACRELHVPVVIAFTVETDGKLPSGHTLEHAIEALDAETNFYVKHYMINCAHPSHFIQQVLREGQWQNRIGGLRCNASVLSHAELNEADVLDEGNPSIFAQLQYVISEKLPNLEVLGGCCGTNISHIKSLAKYFNLAKAN